MQPMTFVGFVALLLPIGYVAYRVALEHVGEENTAFALFWVGLAMGMAAAIIFPDVDEAIGAAVLDWLALVFYALWRDHRAFPRRIS